ncbi:MAG: HNH endonuclease signature motif containing protein [Ruminococcus sp.]
MYKKSSICKYTKSGREEIHKNLKFDDYVLWAMKQLLYEYQYTESVEFTDNKLSLYSAQYGKCAVLGIMLDIDDIHCHHKIPKKFGGGDNYQNLIIVHKDVHKLIHATKTETICKYFSLLNLDKGQIKKINSLRKKANNEPINNLAKQTSKMFTNLTKMCL